MNDKTTLEARAKAMGFTPPLTPAVRAHVWANMIAEDVLEFERATAGRIATANEALAVSNARVADEFARPA